MLTADRSDIVTEFDGELEHACTKESKTAILHKIEPSILNRLQYAQEKLFYAILLRRR